MEEKKEQSLNVKSLMEKLSDFRNEAQLRAYRMETLLDLCSSSSYFNDASSPFDYIGIISRLESEVKELEGFLNDIGSMGYKVDQVLRSKEGTVKDALTPRSHSEGNILFNKIRFDALVEIKAIRLIAHNAEAQRVGGEVMDWSTVMSHIIAGAKIAEQLLTGMTDKAV